MQLKSKNRCKITGLGWAREGRRYDLLTEKRAQVMLTCMSSEVRDIDCIFARVDGS